MQSSGRQRAILVKQKRKQKRNPPKCGQKTDYWCQNPVKSELPDVGVPFSQPFHVWRFARARTHARTHTHTYTRARALVQREKKNASCIKRWSDFVNSFDITDSIFSILPTAFFSLLPEGYFRCQYNVNCTATAHAAVQRELYSHSTRSSTTWTVQPQHTLQYNLNCTDTTRCSTTWTVQPHHMLQYNLNCTATPHAAVQRAEPRAGII